MQSLLQDIPIDKISKKKPGFEIFMHYFSRFRVPILKLGAEGVPQRDALKSGVLYSGTIFLGNAFEDTSTRSLSQFER